MKLLKTFFFIVLFAGLHACGESKKDNSNATSETQVVDGKSTDAAQSEQMLRVMAVHDELMPKMSVIGRLANRINNTISEGEVDAEKQQVIEQLQSANKSMMRWMGSFGKDFSSEEILNGVEMTPEKQRALDRHEKNVLRLKEEMEKAIADGNAIMDQN